MEADIERLWARIHRRRQTAYFEAQTLCRFAGADSRGMVWLSSRKQLKMWSSSDAFLSRPMG